MIQDDCTLIIHNDVKKSGNLLQKQGFVDSQFGTTVHPYNRWLRDTQQSAEGIYCILVGNKCDDTNRRMVVKREAEDWAEEEKIEYYEVSAKEGTNVELVFTRLASKLFLNASMDCNEIELCTYPSSYLSYNNQI